MARFFYFHGAGPKVMLCRKPTNQTKAHSIPNFDYFFIDAHHNGVFMESKIKEVPSPKYDIGQL